MITPDAKKKANLMKTPNRSRAAGYLII